MRATWNLTHWLVGLQKKWIQCRKDLWTNLLYIKNIYILLRTHCCFFETLCFSPNNVFVLSYTRSRAVYAASFQHIQPIGFVWIINGTNCSRNYFNHRPKYFLIEPKKIIICLQTWKIKLWEMLLAWPNNSTFSDEYLVESSFAAILAFSLLG